MGEMTRAQKRQMIFLTAPPEHRADSMFKTGRAICPTVMRHLINRQFTIGGGHF